MLAARYENHVLSGTRQLRAEVAARSACPENRYAHENLSPIYQTVS
jgi:hypothetical protein